MVTVEVQIDVELNIITELLQLDESSVYKHISGYTQLSAANTIMTNMDTQIQHLMDSNGIALFKGSYRFD